MRAFQPEGLEPRLALSTVPPIVMDSATTTDSRSVTISYDVNKAVDPAHPLTFGVYRSASAAFDATALPVGSETLAPSGAGASTLDAAGKPATSVGRHELTISLPNGLPLNPEHPYVLVVANPSDATASADPRATASFRVYTIGVVSHGGLEDKHWKHGPPWEVQIATLLGREGYDAVIPYNWVPQSSTPGEAAKQGPKLERMVRSTLSQFPADAPVDIQFIGHSEGTVVNTQALLRLGANLPQQLKAGWIEETLLDPHAANTTSGQNYSVAHNPLGWLAKGLIDSYQSKAHDPLPTVPSFVDQAQVFYQQNPASRDRNTNAHIYNLWGQVPVKGVADYFNLTATGATHSGKTGVTQWYLTRVVPLLGNGAPELQNDVLAGGILEVGTGSLQPTSSTVITSATPTFAGTSGPGSTVVVFVAPKSQPAALVAVGKTVADDSGNWSITTRALGNGHYRTLAVAHLVRGADPRLDMVPTAPLGELVVQRSSRGSK
jgi:hypothetical protein